MRSPAEQLRAVLDHPYRPDACFVCACPLDERNRTEEHVVPRWLQHEYSLHNQRLGLLNGTSIPYRQLTIPCCFECNNRRLSHLELRIKTAFESGFEAVTQLAPFDLFRWLAKIFLGFQFKELSLLRDRKSLGGETILVPDFVRQYSILHFWLQMASCRHEPDYSPGSIWIFPAQAPADYHLQFDLRDDATNRVIAIRTKNVIVIADFLDNGVHAELTEHHFTPLKRIPLHPLQFQEVVARIVYGARLLCQESDVTFFEVDGQLGYTLNYRSTTEGQSVMNPWMMKDYAQILSYFIQMPADQLYHPNDQVMTWLRNSNGEYVYWPVDKPFSEATPVRDGS